MKRNPAMLLAWGSGGSVLVAAAVAAPMGTGGAMGGGRGMGKGHWNRGIPACANCHDAGPGTRMRAFSPPLSGHHAGHVETRLRQMQSGERGQAMMMPMIALRLTASDIQAVAAYLSQP